MVMANLKRSEMRFIDEVFGVGSGYVLDFSNRTFAEFFEDEFGINIYQDKYETRGSSKANHLRAFIKAENGFLVGKVLRRLWQVREETYVPAGSARVLPEAVRMRFFDLVGRIEAGTEMPVPQFRHEIALWRRMNKPRDALIALFLWKFEEVRVHRLQRLFQVDAPDEFLIVAHVQ
jgi:hypothetical protein